MQIFRCGADFQENALSTVATTMLRAAASADGGFEAPGIGEFFPAPFLFEGTIFELNRIQLVRIIATLVLVALFWLASRNVRLVPTRGQSIAEMALDFVRVNIAEEVIGKNRAKPYVSLLTVMFWAILAMNITGIIPGLNIAGTSVIGVPLILAVVSLIAFIIAGVKAQGGWGFTKASLFPPGVPWPLYIILTPIEILSTFILRPATLTVRLLANMVAGHLLLVTFFAMTHYLFFEASAAIKGVGVVAFGAAFAFTLFEIFVAALQAYIFTLLSAVYLSLSLGDEQ